MTAFYLWPAETLTHAESMRVVRNSCRGFMTRNPFEISIEEQREWFVRLDPKTTRPFIGVLSVGNAGAETIGYGLLRLIDGKWWLSGGLKPEWRGQGYGHELFRELTRRVHTTQHKPAWLEVLKSNEPAIRTYKALGYVTDEELDSVFVMRKNPP